MALYFKDFPKVKYNFDGNQFNRKVTMTDLTFRFKLRDSIKNNLYAYYDLEVEENDTPEIASYQYYKNSEYHWLIAMANDYVDVQYDWPLNYSSLKKYLIKKYGSIENADTEIHHYEKVITRYDQTTRTTTEIVQIIQESTYDALPASSFAQYNLQNTTIEETITKRTVSNREYETRINDEKLNIKVIKDEYLPIIQDEFSTMTSQAIENVVLE